MPALFSVFVSLWMLVAGHLTVHHLDGPVRFTDLYGSPREAVAATGCVNGEAEMWLAPDFDMSTFVHEMAHAYDCVDDGRLNNSPSLRPAERPEWVSDYCWTSDAEWYGCSVEHYRDVHPYRVAPWGPQAIAAAGMAPGLFVGVPLPYQ